MKIIKYFESYSDESNLDEYSKQFIDKFPELKKMKLTKNGNEYCFSSENVDIYIEKNKSDDWDLLFEMCIFEDNINEEKLYKKTNLDWAELNYHIKKVCEYIRHKDIS